jgi:hypothetical protein
MMASEDKSVHHYVLDGEFGLKGANGKGRENPHTRQRDTDAAVQRRSLSSNPGDRPSESSQHPAENRALGSRTSLYATPE